jgi:threonine aldolase
MRRAIAAAELGDDVFGEDPTINRLQERATELIGKEAALFVPSGTMGNQLGVLVNARRRSALAADSLSHTFLSEAGGAATRVLRDPGCAALRVGVQGKRRSRPGRGLDDR